MKRTIATLIVLGLALQVSAQALSGLLIPSDARSLALGGIQQNHGSAIGSAQAIFGIWAPASAGSKIVGGDGYFRFGDRLTISFEGRDFIDTPYEISNYKGAYSGTFQPYEFILALGGSFIINDNIEAGLKIKSVTSIIGEAAKGSAICGDLWASYGTEKWSARLAFRNLGPAIDYGNGPSALPMLAAAGGEWRPISKLLVTGEASVLFSGALMAGLGAEYDIADFVSARAGFHYGDSSKALPSFVSVGLGGHIAGVNLDAAYIFGSPATGNSFMVGLGYSF